jgi:hypothetical protein
MKMNFRSRAYLVISFFLSTMNLSCAGNFYKATAQKETSPALVEAARNALDLLDYDTAITSLLLLQTKDLTSYMTCKTDLGIRNCPRELLAGAYAGRCGFTLLPFSASISSSTGAVFKFLMNSFTSVNVVPADCYKAQQVMETFTAAELTADQKLFLALLGMAKMGTYLRSSADTDKDGVTDATFDSCSTSKISDADVKQVITGMGLFITYSASLSSTGSATSSLTTISTLCTGLGINCSITDPNSSSITTSIVDTFRDLIKSTDYGVETACGNFTPLCCL